MYLLSKTNSNVYQQKSLLLTDLFKRMAKPPFQIQDILYC